MNAAVAYLQTVAHRVERLVDVAGPAIERTAERVATSIADGGVLHVFGTGHSQLVAQELAGRAAGLAAVHAIVDEALSPVRGRRAAATEQLPGYGDVIVDGADLRPGEVFVVVSNSGINAVPIDVAIGAASRGLFVVAVVSRAHSRSASSRHPSGQRLSDVVDLTIDTGSPAGDGAVGLNDGTTVGPLSTLLSAAVLHAVASRAAELLVESGGAAPTLISQNLDVGADVNHELVTRYADRTRS